MLTRNRSTRRQWLSGCSLALGGLSAGRLAAEEEGFRPLFNGADLTGWHGDTLFWLVEDKMIVGRSPGIKYNDFLVSRDSFSDFILRLSCQLVNGEGNSGIQFRSQRVTGSMEMIGYQADIGPGWWGNLYDESRRRKNLAEADPKLLQRILRPAGWNDYEIHAHGRHIRLTLNGGATVDYEEPDAAIPQEGKIGLQIHSGPALEVRFRDIRIKEM